MRKVTETLWIGNAFEARNIRDVLTAGIKAIVDVAIDEPPIEPTRDLICIRIPLMDGSGNSDESLQLAIATASRLIETKVPTLIACSAGISRSPLIAAAALTLSAQTTFSDELCRVVETGPCDLSPTLLNDVRRVTSGL